MQGAHDAKLKPVARRQAICLWFYNRYAALVILPYKTYINSILMDKTLEPDETVTYE
jgi:hypothetical protein